VPDVDILTKHGSVIKPTIGLYALTTEIW